MVPPPISRRAFLAGAGAAAAVAACGRGDGGTRSVSSALQALRVSSELYPSNSPQRFAFTLAEGPEFVAGPAASVAFTAPGGTTSAPRAARLRADGLPEGRGIYVTEAVLDQEGIWQGLIEVEGTESELAFEVTPVESPVPGQPAPVAPSPTITDPLGVDPICTREPRCPLHEVSLADLLGRGQPVAVMFATPARCQTQYCGPVLDLLLDVLAEGSDIPAVHVEIYRSLRGAALVPTVTDWHLQSEPWLFGLDGDGTVVERLDGAFDRTEIRALLARLSG